MTNLIDNFIEMHLNQREDSRLITYSLEFELVLILWNFTVGKRYLKSKFPDHI